MQKFTLIKSCKFFILSTTAHMLLPSMNSILQTSVLVKKIRNYESYAKMVKLKEPAN